MDIIATGDIAKYQLKITRDGFDRETADIAITLSWGRFGDSQTVPSSSFFHDEEGRMFFFFDTSRMFGPVIAACSYAVADDDMADENDEGAEEGKWPCLDRQVICYVEPVPGCGCVHCEADCSDRIVQYARIFRADANTAYEILRDSEGNILLDNDGDPFRVTKSNLI